VGLFVAERCGSLQSHSLLNGVMGDNAANPATNEGIMRAAAQVAKRDECLTTALFGINRSAWRPLYHQLPRRHPVSCGGKDGGPSWGVAKKQLGQWEAE